MQTLSLTMSQHLSSLAPGFEGHWVYGYWGTSKTTSIYCRSAWGITALPENGDKIICPAWQVEDLLRNVDRLFPVMERGNAAYWIADHLRGTSLDATYAYQKIEEYLWTILK